MRKADPLIRLQKQLKARYRKLKSWRKVAVEYDSSGDILSGAMVRLVASGHDPKHAGIRRAFSLPIYATVQVCPRCGKLHQQHKSCGARKRIYKRIADMPTAVLAWKIRNREVAVPFLQAREHD